MAAPKAPEVTIICKGCKEPFTVTARSVETTVVESCSNECRYGRPDPEGMKARFWAKVDKGPHPKGCWLWIGSTYHADRPNMNWKRRVLGAARIAWLITKGEIPDGLHVLHSCDIGLCVNPEHLFLGTNNDNVKDKMRKGRCHKQLPVEKVKALRAAFDGDRSRGALTRIAREHGVDYAVACQIRNGKKYASVK